MPLLKKILPLIFKSTTLFFLYYPFNIFAAYDCILIFANVDFGIINPYDNIFEQTTTSIGVRCTNNGSLDLVSYSLTFSAGSSGSISSRLVKNGVRSLAYNIYRDSSFTQILGTGFSGTVTISNSYTLLGKATKTDYFPIYGKIPVQPLATVGFYSDIITATLTY